MCGDVVDSVNPRGGRVLPIGPIMWGLDTVIARRLFLCVASEVVAYRPIIWWRGDVLSGVWVSRV
jgi:hypothetical protein